MRGAEKRILPDADLEFYQWEYERSGLPETSNAKSDLNELLIRIRLKNYE